MSQENNLKRLCLGHVFYIATYMGLSIYQEEKGRIIPAF